MKRLSAVLAILMVSQTLVAAAPKSKDEVATALMGKSRAAAPAADPLQAVTIWQETYNACYLGRVTPPPSFKADPFQHVAEGASLMGTPIDSVATTHDSSN